MRRRVRFALHPFLGGSVVVVDVDFYVSVLQQIAKGPKPRGRARVHHNDAPHLLELDLLSPLHGKEAPVQAQEVANLRFRLTHADQNGARIELLDGHHAGDGVKIGPLVRNDDFHQQGFWSFGETLAVRRSRAERSEKAALCKFA